MVQFSHPYLTTGKTTALTVRTFFTKVKPLLFSTLSRLAIAFLARIVDEGKCECGSGSWQRKIWQDFKEMAVKV